MSLRKTIWKTGGVPAAALLLVAPWALSQTPGGANAGRGGRGGMVVAAPAFDYANNEGWLQLFNGRDLTGWDGDTRYWNVDDGAIHVEPTCEKPTGTIYLVWQGGEPSDFMLKWESKGTEQVNGGIQFRSYMTADPNVHLKYYGRGGGGGTLVTAATAGGGRGPGGPGGRGPGGSGGQGGGGRAAQSAPCPSGQPRGTAPSRAEEAKWDMAGPQADFDAANQWPGSYYEQSSPRFIASAPGYVTLGLPGGQRVTLATLHDQATRDSWFKKNDYNQFLLVAKGNTIAQYMNGHLMSLFIDDDPDLFLPSGKIGIEVEATGGYWTRNIYLKRL